MDASEKNKVNANKRTQMEREARRSLRKQGESSQEKQRTIRRKKPKEQHIPQYSHRNRAELEQEFDSIKPRDAIDILFPGGLITAVVASGGTVLGFNLAMFIMNTFMNPNPDSQSFGGVVEFTIVMCIIALFMLGTSPFLRRLCYRLKHIYLQRYGMRAEAAIIGRKKVVLEGEVSFDMYDFKVLWHHPETDQLYGYENHYTFFFSPMGKKGKLLDNYYAGTSISVVFSPKHPHYFALETPFTPCWFDTLF